MKKLWMVLSSVTILIVTGCSTTKVEKHEVREKTVYNDQNTLRQFISQWPVASRFAAEDMVEKYGLPDSVSNDSIVWEETGYFKRSIVYRDGVTHNFPSPHQDVLQQFVGYRIPAGKVEELWKFDGSITVDRTRGEISSRCNREEMNVLALNLADNIIQNRMKVPRAREVYEASAKSFMKGDPTTNYMAGLNFSEYLNAGDPDHSIMERDPGSIQAQEARPGE